MTNICHVLVSSSPPQGQELCAVECFVLLDRLLYILLGKTRSNICTSHLPQKVPWFALVPAPLGVQSTDLIQAQESFITFYLAVGHNSHLQVYHNIFTSLVINRHKNSDVMLS